MSTNTTMETVAELNSKISGYRKQLSDVEALLSTDTHNEQFLKLKEDLLKVIQLTSDLITYQTNDNPTDSFVASQSSNYDKQNTTVSVGGFSVGDRVEVNSGERPFAAVIIGIDSVKMECRLKYFEFEEEVILQLSSLHKFESSAFDSLDVHPPAFKCQCKYATDQKWYDVTVDAVTEYGFMVTYTQYGNVEEVPLEYLRPTPTKKDGGKDNKLKPDNNGIIPIPESLKILPTDTEEEKNRKKKKLKAIKSTNRIKTQEIEVTATQKTWQSFVNKSGKRALTGVVKQSMFASPDVVEGKVGVTNSGLGMTDFERRKRHNFGPLGASGSGAMK